MPPLLTHSGIKVWGKGDGVLPGTPGSCGLSGQSFCPGKQGRREDHRAPSDGREGQMSRAKEGGWSGLPEDVRDFLELRLSGYMQAVSTGCLRLAPELEQD